MQHDEKMRETLAPLVLPGGKDIVERGRPVTDCDTAPLAHTRKMATRIQALIMEVSMMVS